MMLPSCPAPRAVAEGTTYLECPDTVCLAVQIPDVSIDSTILGSNQDNTAEATSCASHLTHPHSCCSIGLCDLQLRHRSDLSIAGQPCEVAASNGRDYSVAWQVQHKPSGGAGEQGTVDLDYLDIWLGLATCSKEKLASAAPLQ
jgi:hypothetical protein